MAKEQRPTTLQLLTPETENIDTGAKVVHNAPNTKSTIESKSISQGSGRTNYRGLVRIPKGSSGSKPLLNVMH